MIAHRSWFPPSKIAYALLLLVLSVGCNPRPSGAKAPETGSPILEMHCFYVMDEKYHEERSPEKVANWKQGVMAQAARPEEKFGPYDLFTHKGGGPAGAEWNSDGDIWVLCLGRFTPKQIDSVSVWINDEQLYPRVPTLESGDRTLMHFKMSGYDWQSALQEIEEKDFPLLYSEELLNNHRQQSNNQIGVGGILRIRFQVWFKVNGKQKTAALTRAFHQAGGE